MKRKLKWLAIVLAVSLLGSGTALLLWPRDRITAESWQKIRIGMTEDEVAEILGGPGLDLAAAEFAWTRKNKGKLPFRLQRRQFFVESEESFSFNEYGRSLELHGKVWIGRSGIINIYDKNGLVTAKLYRGICPTELDLIDRLRDWLGW
jgi:hypothetical protein